ncbi:MAG: hypothetical protein M3Y20_04560, partial [Actinomycetota bacterium]|nr:hypothetical protein [Actinomycetota bacterium]
VWLEAELEGRDVLASAVVGRFRPDFVPAFEAWRALGVGDELAPGSPFELAEYRLPESVEAERLSGAAEDASRRGADAGETSDRYVLTAVLFASVLFLAGIATKIATPRGSKLAVVLSLVMFVFATVVTFTLPISVGGLR